MTNNEQLKLKAERDSAGRRWQDAIEARTKAIQNCDTAFQSFLSAQMKYNTYLEVKLCMIEQAGEGGENG